MSVTAHGPLIVQVAAACLVLGITVVAALLRDRGADPEPARRLSDMVDLSELPGGDVVQLPLVLTVDQIVNPKDAELLDQIQRRWFEREGQ